MKSETMTSNERFETAVNLKEPDRVPVCPLGMLFAAPYAGITMEKYYTDLDALQKAQRQVFDGLGGWDVVGLAGTAMTDIFALMTVFPNKMKRPGKELPADSISQFDESTPSMSLDDYNIIIKKGWNYFFFKHLYRRIQPDDESSIFGSGKVLVKLMSFLWTYRKDIRYWQKRGVPVLVSGPCGVPYEMFSTARTFNQFILDIRRHPDLIKAAMDAVLSATISMVVRGAKFLGVPRVFLTGERGSGDVISPSYFENFYLPWLLQLVDALIKENITPLLHFDGNWDRNLPYLKELPRGKCILDLDSTTNIFKAKEILGDRMCIMGDVPASLLTLGTPEEVESYCKKLIDEIGRGGGFILSSGCTVPYNAKIENLKAMINTGKTYQLSK
ncbi:MAG: uroporphyrinogen-III decarboxylase [Acidobacteria bacterium]|jgi:uroporphyrinogen-III decarboxylase|nr:uroporphyrinogen-III decarboxylase [Acidobacteriota bacterium]